MIRIFMLLLYSQVCSIGDIGFSGRCYACGPGELLDTTRRTPQCTNSSAGAGITADGLRRHLSCDAAAHFVPVRGRGGCACGLGFALDGTGACRSLQCGPGQLLVGDGCIQCASESAFIQDNVCFHCAANEVVNSAGDDCECAPGYRPEPSGNACIGVDDTAMNVMDLAGEACVGDCGGNFLNIELRQCEEDCGWAFEALDEHRCTASCGAHFVDADGRRCIDECPADQFVIQAWSRCAADCGGFYTDVDNRTCVGSCGILHLSEPRCVGQCDDGYLNLERDRCVGRCPAGQYITA